MKELQQLQRLCDISNRRYNAGQNDDDQVRRLFNFAKKQTSVCVLIGYDDYQATTAEEVLNFYKENPETEVKKEGDFVYIKMNYKTAQIHKSLIN